VVVGVDDGGWTMNPPSVLTLLESAALRKAIGVHLSSEGYVVTEAQTVPAVVAVLDRRRVDIVIVGYATQGDADVVDLLRRLSATNEAPVILITDSAAVRQLPTDALPAVAEVFVRGRFSIAELKRFVAHAVTKP
jgi:DNA-binding response OmpR family regulator